MRKKIIVLRSKYGKPNIDILYNYFEEYLSERYKNKISVKIYNKKFKQTWSLERFLLKLKFYFRSFLKYDFIVSDYYDHLFFESGKQTMFIVHGAVFKSDPSKIAMNSSKSVKHFSRQRINTNHVITLGNNDKSFFLQNDVLNKLKLPKYRDIGLPRNDVLFNEEWVRRAKQEMKNKHNLNSDYVVLYAPTYRPYTDFDPPFNNSDLSNLNEVLIKSNSIMLYRPHYFKPIMQLNIFEGYSNIKVITSESEANTAKLLCCVDHLITDYSSIFIDFLCLKKPISFFHFDQKKYFDESGYNLDFSENYIPGPVILNTKCLIQDIEEQAKVGYCKLHNFHQAVQFFYSHFDGNSSQRIWEYILNEVGV